MSSEAVRVVERIQEALLTLGDVVVALNDPEEDERLRRILTELAEPDFEVAMVGPAYVGQTIERSGVDGFREAWVDWTSPFSSYRIDLEEIIDAGDRVVSLVAMSGKTKTGGVEIEADAAAVWTVVDGRLRRVEFHIDRESARRSAGLSD